MDLTRTDPPRWKESSGLGQTWQHQLPQIQPQHPLAPGHQRRFAQTWQQLGGEIRPIYFLAACR